MGLHIIRPEFGNPACGHLILSPSTKENCPVHGQLSPVVQDRKKNILLINSC